MINQKTPVENYQKVIKDAELLYTDTEINKTIDDISKAITRELKTSNPIIMPIMIGGLILAGQLIPKLNFPLQIDYIHATRYNGNTRGGKLNWFKKPNKSLVNKTILLIDDILDEGTTLCAIGDYCLAHGASKVLTAVLVDKAHDRKSKPGLKADFTGLYVEDRFLFGYGMDYKGYWRNAPGIYAVKGL